MLLPKATAFGLRTTPMTLAAAESSEGGQMTKLMAWVQALQYHEMLLLVQALLVGITLIVCIIHIRRLYKRRSYLYVDFVSFKDICSIHLTNLPDATRDYSIGVPRKTTVRIYSWGPIGVLVFVTSPWKIVRGRDGKIFPCPAWIFVSGSQARKVQAIAVIQDHTCAPLIIHSHHYEFQHVKNSTKEGERAVDINTSRV